MERSLYEQFRLSRLDRLGLLDTPPDERFDRITRIARDVYKTEVALVSLLDANRQWFKSRQGHRPTCTDRALAFCHHAILTDQPFVIGNAATDSRFSDNALVVGEPYIRFYAGIPIKEPTGFRVGTLCVLDSKPREVGSLDLTVLSQLATLLEEEIARLYFMEQNTPELSCSELLLAINRVQAIPVTKGSDGRSSTKNSVNAFLRELMIVSESPAGALVEVLDGSLIDPLARHGITLERLTELLEPFTGVDVKEAVAETTKAAYERAVLPVLLNGQIAGLLLLAGREGGYPSRLFELLNPVTYAIGNLIDRIRLQRVKREQAELDVAADNHDPVTGLPNQVRLASYLHQYVDQDLTVVAVCHLTLDNDNDTGEVSDSPTETSLLARVADRLQHVVRRTDFIARVGHREFVIILEEGADSSVCDRILTAVRESIKTRRRDSGWHVSMGVAFNVSPPLVPSVLLRNAFQAMLVARDQGWNSYEVYDYESQKGRKEQTRFMADVEHGLASGQFELHYQPKIDLSSNAVYGFEGLIRWNHPQDGLLTPNKFLPQLAFKNLDIQLGNEVIRQGVDVLARFVEQGLPYTLSINLSPHHFLSEQFLADLRHCLEPYSSAVVARLTLEILESTVLDEACIAIETAHACRQMGVRLSLDDFGTGYSSLSHFQKLPVDEIKIDRSFIRDIQKNPADGIIVQAIIDLAHKLNRVVVAEGIENESMEQKLRQMGCDRLQGFYFSPPKPLDEALMYAGSLFGHRMIAPEGSIRAQHQNG